MNKLESKKAAEIMAAYAAGAAIQMRIGNGDWIDLNENPSWNWHTIEYRLKPDPIFVPYGTIKEFLDAQKEHGPFVWFSSTVYNMPKTVIELDGKVIATFDTPAYESMSMDKLVNYRWQDGSVCGNRVHKE